MRRETEFTANLALARAVPAVAASAWMKPSTCKRPVAVKISVVKRVWRAILEVL